MLSSPVEEIKQRLDVIDVLGEYLQMKKAGGNHKALCPFHNEKTPSFMVSQEKQIWHCFGCAKGGDIFEFIQEIEGVDFPEALRILANKANVTLRARDPKLENQKTKILEILKTTAHFFQEALLENEQGKEALAYLTEARKLTEETIEDFKLGYAFDDWEKLSQYLLKQNFKEEDIFLAGLTVKKEKGTGSYDRFRNRIMFPITDVHGNVIGFTGRLLKEDPERPGGKYVNTPQTGVYDKSRVIYGLDKAKTQIKQLGATILVEGQMDVIMAVQKGFKNIVASSGTALTEEQVHLLKRYSPNLILAFDMDDAGLEAAKRGIEQAMQAEMNVKVMLLPEQYKDPDDCLKQDAAAFKKAIQQAQNILDYYFQISLKELDLSKVDDKKKAVKRLLPILSTVADPVERTHYLQKLSGLVNVPEEILRQKIDPQAKKTTRTSAAKQETDKTEKKAIKTDRFTQLSEQIIALALKQSEDFKYFIDNLSPDFLTKPDLQVLYKDLINYYNQEENLNLQEFVKDYPNHSKRVEVLSLLIEGEFSDLSEKDLQNQIIKIIQLLEKNYIQQRMQVLEQEIKQAEAAQQQDKINSLSQEFNLFTQKLAQLL